MKKFLLVFLSLVLGIIFFVFALQKFSWEQIWNSANILSWWQFLLVMFLFLISFLISIFRWKFIISSRSKEKVFFWTALKARVVGFTLSYLTPSVYFGGEALRGMILNEESNLDWTTNIFSIIVDKAIDMTVGAMIMLFGLAYILIYFNLPNWLNLIIWSVVFIWLVSGYLFYSRAFRGKGFFTSLINFFWLNRVGKVKKLSSNIQDIEHSIYEFVHNTRYLISAFVLAFAGRMFYLCAAWLIITFLQVKVNIFQVLGFMAVTAIMYFVPVPGSLGIHETSQAIFFNLFGLGGYNGVAFTLIIRVLQIIGVIIGLSFLFLFQIKVWKHKAFGGLNRFGKKINDMTSDD
ncbi:lysylphosphatidylglycerol synthase transmembrane domain-containing protein [Patescibacteria group bacterium]